MFRVLVANSEHYISCLDRERRVLFLSRTLSRDLPNVLGRRTEEFVAEQHREEAIRTTEAAFISGEPQRMEIDVLLADGHPHCFEIRTIPFRGPDDEPLALQITADLTERRHLIQKLSHSERLRTLIVENLPDYVVLIDRDLRFRWINRVAPGLTLDRVLGASVEDFVSEPDRPRFLAAVRWAFETGEPTQYEVEA